MTFVVLLFRGLFVANSWTRGLEEGRGIKKNSWKREPMANNGNFFLFFSLFNLFVALADSYYYSSDILKSI